MAPNLFSAFGAKNCSCSFISMNVNDQDDCMETWTHKDRLDRLKFLYNRLGRLPTIETIIWKPGLKAIGGQFTVKNCPFNFWHFVFEETQSKTNSNNLENDIFLLAVFKEFW